MKSSGWREPAISRTRRPHFGCARPASRSSRGSARKRWRSKIGVRQTTYASYETGDAYPTPMVIRHFRREYEFNFDFIMYGDWRRLPGDRQDAVFDAMLALEAKADRKADRG